jgi:type III pantothenate kinase
MPERHGVSGPPVILAIDVGNTRTSAAIIRHGQVSCRKTVSTAEIESVTAAIASLWSSTAATDNCRIVCASVVPSVLAALREFCDTELGRPLVAIKEDVGFAIPLDLETPETVGADRVCAATAAYAMIRQSCVVADFGTAITIDLVGDDGTFLGGTILPGIQLSAKTLHDNTAALPLVDVIPSGRALGKSTVSAINTGVFLASIGALREIVERMATEIGRWPVLVVTGGDAQGVADHCDFVDKVVPDLCLLGVAMTYEASQASERD